MEAFGAGCMLGSAFAVVLPEGFDALYSAAARTVHDDEHEQRRRLLSVEDEGALDHDRGHTHHSGFPSWAPGVAVLAGFLLMMIFEFWHHQHEHEHMSQEGPQKVRNQLFSCSKVRLYARQRLLGD
jgi:zinc transporter ZupT